jgi:hypothetical protein
VPFAGVASGAGWGDNNAVAQPPLGPARGSIERLCYTAGTISCHFATIQMPSVMHSLTSTFFRLIPRTLHVLYSAQSEACAPYPPANEQCVLNSNAWWRTTLHHGHAGTLLDGLYELVCNVVCT